ncbi:MAG TPA: alpha/beta fold hydrolase [Methylomirabilota bacterium]|nr:alpha/beta fold hydrolase [Methylomirabilota bacterium]
MTQLSIGLLGGFRAQLGSGRLLTIRRKKAQALLAYLALRPDVSHSRESLAGLLWSGTTDQHARHNLRQTLFALRQALPSATAPLRREGETVGLRGSAVTVDTAAFERCVQRGTREALHEAAALYRGELLEGFTLGESPFDDWVAAERHRLRGLALEGLEKLLAMDVAVDASERAVATGLRLLALDPLRETAHRTLMELYARQGRRTLALRQYQLCIDALRRELGVGPEADTTRLYRHIREQPPEGEAGRDRAAAAALPTRYTRSGDVNLAYQVVGEGKPDLVLVPGWVSNVECFWEEPRVARFLRRLASVGRLILFDKRGTGLSDRVALDSLPTLEQRMADVQAVMDAVASERAVLVGCSEGGPMCALFAATYPERTAGLVMIGSYARQMWRADYPWGYSTANYARFLEALRRGWGGPVGIKLFAASAADDPAFRDWWARYLRMSASPGAAEAFSRMNTEIDVRHVLSAVRVPTLVLHAAADKTVDVRAAHDMAARIPHARYVELPSADHLPWLSDAEAILGEIERFVRAPQPARDVDRLLLTVVVVEQVATWGGDGERGRADFREIARREIVRFRGRFLQASGPALLAAFDGPARAVRSAGAIVDEARRLGLTARAGLHTGECEVGPEGLTGTALDMARRVTAAAKDGEVIVSSTVKDLVAGSGIEFVLRAEKSDGEPEERPLFAVASPP